MVKELIIHLGDCKTGSTAIQTCLVDNGYELPEGRIVYPTRFNHIPLAHSLSDSPDLAHEKQYMVPRFVKVASAFATSNADWGILSAETFEFISPLRLKEALDRFFPFYKNKIRLVSYVRPHHSKVVSAFSEQVKKTGQPNRMEQLFERRLKAGQLNYHKRFSEWRAVFGDAFTLRPFVRNQLLQGDVVADFLSFVAGRDDVNVLEVPHTNTSLSVQNLAMLKLIHQRLGKHPELEGATLKKVRDDLGWHIAPYLSAHEPSDADRVKIHLELALRVQEACREDAERLDADFFEGSPMVTALEAAPDQAIHKEQSFNPAHHFSPAERGMIKGWADFIGHIAAGDPDHFSWAARRDVERYRGSAGGADYADTDPAAPDPSGGDPSPRPPANREATLLRRVLSWLR